MQTNSLPGRSNKDNQSIPQASTVKGHRNKAHETDSSIPRVQTSQSTRQISNPPTINTTHFPPLQKRQIVQLKRHIIQHKVQRDQGVVNSDMHSGGVEINQVTSRETRLDDFFLDGR